MGVAYIKSCCCFLYFFKTLEKFEKVGEIGDLVFVRELNVSRWLEAHSDRSSQFSVLPKCLILTDVLGDDDYQLVVADFIQNRLRAYKRILNSDIILSDLPNSLITFYTNQLQPRVPAVAVACGSDLLIYKNNKPYFKFRIPTSSIERTETNLSTNISTERGVQETSSTVLLEGSVQELSNISSSHHAIVKDSSITCMCTLKRSSCDKKALSCPVLATESGNIYFLDPQTFAILQQANTCSKKSTPFLISSTGIFDVEYKIIIGCREGHICILMRGWLEGKLIIELIHDIVDLLIIPGDNFIVVATTQKSVSCATKRGQNLWSIKTMNPVICLCLVTICHMNVNLIAVGLRGGIIQLYHGRCLVDTTTVPESPSTIAFGQLGQEENVMVVITLTGTVTYKILKRTADFNVRFKENVPILQCKPIPLPKRSKLFLEQSLRERNTAVDMHQFFQQDLMRIRLKNASELASCIKNLENREFKVEAKVIGLGPKFTIILTLENLNTKKCVKELSIILHKNAYVSYVSPNVIKIPIMPPCYRYKVKIQLEELTNKDHLNEVTALSVPSVKIYATKRFHVKPDLTVTLNLPSTDNIFCF